MFCGIGLVCFLKFPTLVHLNILPDFTREIHERTEESPQLTLSELDSCVFCQSKMVVGKYFRKYNKYSETSDYLCATITHINQVVCTLKGLDSI